MFLIKSTFHHLCLIVPNCSLPCRSIADVGKGISCVLSAFYFLDGMGASEQSWRSSQGLSPVPPTETPDSTPTTLVWPAQTLCYIQAMGIQYFEVAGFLWPALIATHLYLAICRQVPRLTLRKLFPVYLIVGFGIPLAFVIIVAAIQALGNGSPAPQISWYDKIVRILPLPHQLSGRSSLGVGSKLKLVLDGSD